MRSAQVEIPCCFWKITQEHERIVKNAKLRAVRAKARIWRVSGTPASRLGLMIGSSRRTP